MFRMSDVGASTRKRILWVGDAVVASGFALATHKILDRLVDEWNPVVLGLNYNGDPHRYPYPIFTAACRSDWTGANRIAEVAVITQPDVIVIQQDGWNLPLYMAYLKKYEINIPIVAVVAVDGKNFNGAWLTGITHAIFWTEFALHEARQGGYQGPASVIPLGIDLDVYYPVDRYEARGFRLARELEEAFIVGNVNRNQPRKRWDLSLKYFARWIQTRKISDAYLYFHAAPTGEEGVKVEKLAEYYGITDRVICTVPPLWYGDAEESMRDTYSCFDVQISTTQGEGFGLTTFEGMACGVPQIVPRWSALEELCEGAACLVPCSSTAIGPPFKNVIGGVVDEDLFVASLDVLYRDAWQREHMKQAGLLRVKNSRFRWDNIAMEYASVLNDVLMTRELERAS